MAHTRIIVSLVGLNDDIFGIISRVKNALKEHGYHDESKKFVEEALGQSTVEKVIEVAQRFVRIKT